VTPRQKDMLDAIRDLTVDGVSPTYEQLRVHLGIASKSGVNRMIVALERLGRVRRIKGCRRTVEIIAPLSPVGSTVSIADRICRRANEEGSVSASTPDTAAMLRSIVLEALR